jgi:nucleoside-diphosphate-sugar epimerase
MRIVVFGATGNVGTSVVRALARDERVQDIVGVARRVPRHAGTGRLRWVRADVVSDPLEPIVEGADAVIHLAWAIQPSHDPAALRAINVHGSGRVFAAAAGARAALVHASSIGAYSPGPKDRPVDESWPHDGVPTSFYARHKAEAEHMLDELERTDPELRVVRLRPGLIFKRDAAQEIRRYFIGPLLPSPLVRRGLVPVIPSMPGLAFQALHADDVAEAYRLAAVDPSARGAYNVAADPVLDVPTLARVLHARPVPVPPRVVRTLADVTWRLRLQPTPPGWLDMGLAVPLMDTTRARQELGWTPRRSADEALLELLDGLRDAAGGDTPALAADAGGPLRLRELLSGVGGRNR